MKKRKKRRGRASTTGRLEDIQVEMLDKVARQFKFDVTEIGSFRFSTRVLNRKTLKIADAATAPPNAQICRTALVGEHVRIAADIEVEDSEKLGAAKRRHLEIRGRSEPRTCGDPPGPAPQTRYGDPKRAARPFRVPKTCLW